MPMLHMVAVRNVYGTGRLRHRAAPIRVFFFSSRRRHTRCSRDWSSDVCSSDLLGAHLLALTIVHKALTTDIHQQVVPHGAMRSEERRVGKECRSRWSPYH